MPSAIRSALDVAVWFEARAEQGGFRLAPLKLQALLYLAQATYAGAKDGRRLMPSLFVAGPVGPVEPNLYVILELGLPNIVPATPSREVEACLSHIWRRFGRLSAADLGRLIEADGQGANRLNEVKNREIPLSEMAAVYRRLCGAGEVPTDDPPPAPAAQPPSLVPPDDQPIRFTADGRSVTKWRPKRRVHGPPTIKLGAGPETDG